MLAMLPISHIITSLDAGQFFRDAGLVTWTAIAFWAAATRMLWKRTHSMTEPAQPTASDRGYATFSPGV
jgi:hypothetical protein